MMVFFIQNDQILDSEAHFAAAGLKLFLSELSSSEAHKPENGALELLKSLQLLVGLRPLL